MSLLAPLYALGALAIGLPILFHLIQRRPRGEQPFSSLMFLSPSPPRLTRRSRLDNLLLLFLRALALVLLAIAFARPFLRSFSHATASLPSRHAVLLIDSSASMRRGDLWQQAVTEATKIADDFQPHDRLALLCYDAQVHSLISIDASTQANRPPYRLRVQKALDATEPSWGRTELGQALLTALDAMQLSTSESNAASTSIKQIFLISDLQAGSRLESLESMTWPEDVQLVVRALECDSPSNAGLKRLVAEDHAADDAKLRIRVMNDLRSSEEQFELVWRLENGQLDDTTRYAVHVPAGQQRVLRLKQHPTAKELVLFGDNQTFDNRLFIPRPARATKTLLYLGHENDDPDSLYYFLKRAPLGTPQYQVIIQPTWPPAGLDGLNPFQCPLVITSESLAPHDIEAMRHYVESGGRLLVVLDEPTDADPPMEQALATLLDVRTVSITKANVKDYSMFANISFRHPLFQSFADRRFNDFTKIRVWQHRHVSSDHEEPWEVLMQFDDRSPALVESVLSDGVIWVLTTGWQPSQSQLALSTKFVPLLAGMFDENQDVLYTPADYDVGQVVELSQINAHAEVRTPDGKTVRMESRARAFAETQLPGIYVVHQTGTTDEFAINVEANESKTAPMDMTELEQRGIRLSEYLDRNEMERRDRQLKDFELESRQQVWRWLIVAVLCLLITETTLAGRVSRTTVAADSENS